MMLSTCQRLIIFKVLRTSGLIKEIRNNEFLKHPKIKWLTYIGLLYNKSIRDLVRLAQVVEQWTGNPEVGGSSPPSKHLIFGCLRNSF